MSEEDTQHHTSSFEGTITVKDVYDVANEHMQALDHLWPDSDSFGPRKVHIVELLDGFKLRLIEKAAENASKDVGAFERAARKITGYDPRRKLEHERKKEESGVPDQSFPPGPTTQEQAQAARERIAKSQRNQ